MMYFKKLGKDSIYRDTSDDYWNKTPVDLLGANSLPDVVLNDVGANARLDEKGNFIPNSDAVDKRVIGDFSDGDGYSGNGKYKDERDFPGGWPTIAPGTPYPDTDHDGMSDVWEADHGFSSTDASDGNGDRDGDGYTNIEEFLNGTDPGSITSISKSGSQKKFVQIVTSIKTTQRIIFGLSSDIAQAGSCTIYTIQGKRIRTILPVKVKGGVTYSVKRTGLAQQLYIVKINFGESSFVSKFLF
jgi:hypothetical protein